MISSIVGRPLMMLLFAVAYTLASPANYVTSKSSATSYASPAVTILKQINQLNDDGSYTFGFEASDGSYRVENMDVNGYMTGKYGYIDAYGQAQETEYAAGKMAGQSVGFQARGTLLNDVRSQQSAVPFHPNIRQVGGTESFRLPVHYPQQQRIHAGGVRISTPAKTSYDIQPTVVRVVNPHVSPFVDVNVATPVRQNNNAANVRFVSSSKNSYETQPTSVRVADPYDAAVSDIRVLTPTKVVLQTGIPNVRVPVKSSSRRTNNVVRLINQNDDAYVKNTNVRVTAPTRISYDQAPSAIRAINRETATYDSFPIVKQTVEPSKTIQEVAQVAAPVARLDPYGYRKSSGRSTGRLDEFLRSLKTNNRNKGDSYNTHQSGSSDFIIQTDFDSQEVFQTVQDFQPIQDDAISVDSFGVTRII
ncbi:hypothetical protein GHT06_016914 [Daphnia sinensis]|uniref:Uncharacterized protein n=1 Tax=Daphnia sinensis TaxID=1820382 RepID=A0AAD5PRG9_9CRUS|nr:hypothetical protein GHT06_016914 [Daphnia sinensis]